MTQFFLAASVQLKHSCRRIGHYFRYIPCNWPYAGLISVISSAPSRPHKIVIKTS